MVLHLIAFKFRFSFFHKGLQPLGKILAADGQLKLIGIHVHASPGQSLYQLRVCQIDAHRKILAGSGKNDGPRVLISAKKIYEIYYFG